MNTGLTLATAGLAGFGLGLGLVLGSAVVRLIRANMRDPEDHHG